MTRPTMAGTLPADPQRRHWLSAGLTTAAVAALAPLAGSAAAAAPSAAAATDLLRLDLNESSYGPSPRVGPAVQRALVEAEIGRASCRERV